MRKMSIRSLELCEASRPYAVGMWFFGGEGGGEGLWEGLWGVIKLILFKFEFLTTFPTSSPVINKK